MPSASSPYTTIEEWEEAAAAQRAAARGVARLIADTLRHQFAGPPTSSSISLPNTTAPHACSLTPSAMRGAPSSTTSKTTSCRRSGMALRSAPHGGTSAPGTPSTYGASCAASTRPEPSSTTTPRTCALTMTRRRPPCPACCSTPPRAPHPSTTRTTPTPANGCSGPTARSRSLNTEGRIAMPEFLDLPGRSTAERQALTPHHQQLSKGETVSKQGVFAALERSGHYAGLMVALAGTKSRMRAQENSVALEFFGNRSTDCRPRPGGSLVCGARRPGEPRFQLHHCRARGSAMVVGPRGARSGRRTASRGPRRPQVTAGFSVIPNRMEQRDAAWGLGARFLGALCSGDPAWTAKAATRRMVAESLARCAASQDAVRDGARVPSEPPGSASSGNSHTEPRG
ncbi:hypothetical protein DWB77_00006 [Streptomyces hundungensis]|uniref:Uncharacterized protein n=1 Tax=Streptomyces hundungensis TaxID=1077946 RepID=A0A387H418_9ACTN|nr:hypothetical protein DWB77_00006 [Streptomyces hundungensis]